MSATKISRHRLPPTDPSFTVQSPPNPANHPNTHHQLTSTSTPPPSPATLSTLPDDILQQIFEYVSTYELLRICYSPVSKSLLHIWHRLYAYTIDLDNLNDSHHTAPTGRQLRIKRTYGDLVRKAADCVELHTLRLQNLGALCDDTAVAVPLSIHCDTLNELNISGNALIQPVIHCEVLTALDLSRSKYLTYPSIQCPQLYELDISKTFVNDQQIDFIINCSTSLFNLSILRLAHCKNVKTLNISLPNLSVLDLTATSILDDSVATVLQQCSKLTILSLDQCKSIRNPVLASDTLTVLTMQMCEELRQPVLHLPSLTELDVSSTNLRDTAFAQLLSTVPELQRLSVRQCLQLNDPLLVAPLTQLHTVDCSVSSISSAGLNRLVFHSPQLEHLYAKQCVNVTELPVNDCSNLIDIVLKSTPVNDQTVQQFVQSASSLTQVNLTNCLQVTASTIQSPSLMSVDVSCCDLVTDETLFKLLSGNCTNLTYLNVSFCRALHHTVIPANQLKQLHVACCRSMETLEIHAAALELIDMSTNLSLTQCTISNVSTNLQTLNICDLLPFVTASIVAQLRQQVTHYVDVHKQITMSANTPNSPYTFAKRRPRTTSVRSNANSSTTMSLPPPALLLEDDEESGEFTVTAPTPYISPANLDVNGALSATAVPVQRRVRRTTHMADQLSPQHSVDGLPTPLISPTAVSGPESNINSPLNSPTRRLMACQRASYNKRYGAVISPDTVSNTVDPSIIISPTNSTSTAQLSPTRRSGLNGVGTPSKSRSLFTFDAPNLSASSAYDTLALPLPPLTPSMPPLISQSPRSMSVANTMEGLTRSVEQLQLKRSQSVVEQSTSQPAYVPKSFICSIEIYVIQQRIAMLEHRLKQTTSSAVTYGLKKQMLVQRAKLRKEEMALRDLETKSDSDSDNR